MYSDGICGMAYEIASRRAGYVDGTLITRVFRASMILIAHFWIIRRAFNRPSNRRAISQWSCRCIRQRERRANAGRIDSETGGVATRLTVSAMRNQRSVSMVSVLRRDTLRAYILATRRNVYFVKFPSGIHRGQSRGGDRVLRRASRVPRVTPLDFNSRGKLSVRDDDRPEAKA